MPIQLECIFPIWINIMICIKNLEQYELKILNFNSLYCLLFSKINSPPCLVMERELSIICKKYSIPLFKIDCDLKELFTVIDEYNIGMLPKYLFIKNDKILYKETGTEVRFIIEKHINKWGLIT